MRAEFKLGQNERTIQQQATSATPIFEFFFRSKQFFVQFFRKMAVRFPGLAWLRTGNRKNIRTP